MHILYKWLSKAPPSLIHSCHSNDIGQYLMPNPTLRFMTYMWHTSAVEISLRDESCRHVRPQDKIVHLVNEEAVVEELESYGIPCSFVNHNAFLDERLFDIKDSVTPTFDAVYNARMAPFKRHLLARLVPSVLMIGGVVASDDTHEYFGEVRDAIPQASFVHANDNRHRSDPEVVDLLNQTRVGLCLSASEGAMFAATEYLLCGLPVVSTVSKGGRDAWFESEFSRIVPDEPQAVADAVAELIELKIPPEEVREAALKRIWEHRRRFIDLGQSAYSAWNVGREFARDFYTNFTHKMGEWRAPEDVMMYYDQARCW